MLNRKNGGESIIFSDGPKTVLTIGEKEQENGILMTLTGELRSEVAHDLQDELVALTTVGADVVVDMSGVTYISSAVQHVFLTVQQKMDTMSRGTLVLKGMSDAIYSEFDKTGTSELLMIED